MSVSIETKKNFLGQFASFCTMCKDKIIHQDKEDCHETCPYGNIVQAIGERNENGDLVDEIDYEYKNSEMNLLLLCNEHRSPLSQMSVAKKVALKTQTKEVDMDDVSWVESELSQYESCEVRFSDLMYLNILRLKPFALENGQEVNVPRFNNQRSLHSQDWVKDELIKKFDSFFSRFKMDAILFNGIKNLHEEYIGELSYFENLRFSSKNIGQVVKREEDYSHLFYTHPNGWQLVLYINQNWIATGEAFAEFTSSRQSELNGLFRITNVDFENKTMYGTPFALAFPK